MYAIAIIIIGLVVLAIFLLYAFGVFGHGKALLGQWFSFGNAKSTNASRIAGTLSG